MMDNFNGPAPPEDTDSSGESASNQNTHVVRIPLDLISPGLYQARRHFAESALDELAASIAESGVIQPIVVRGERASGYTLLAGERRWRAAARAGVHELPAVIRNDLDDQQAAVLGLIENLQRESLGVVDTAIGLDSLCSNHGLTHDGVAERIGKSRAYVTNYLRVLKLTKPVQELLEQGRLSLGHAKMLAGLSSAAQQQLAQRAADSGMSVRALERRVRRGVQSTNNSNERNERDPALADLEQRLSTHLGNKVCVSYAPDSRRGQLRIDFHGLDEFDGLLARLGFDGEK